MLSWKRRSIPYDKLVLLLWLDEEIYEYARHPSYPEALDICGLLTMIDFDRTQPENINTLRGLSILVKSELHKYDRWRIFLWYVVQWRRGRPFINVSPMVRLLLQMQVTST